MSELEPGVKTQEPDNQTEPKPVTSFVDQLVQAKGNDAFRDPEAIAKSKLESDAYIERLKEENSKLQSEISNRKSAEEALAEITAKAEMMASQVSRPAEPSTSEDTTTGVAEDQVEAIVSKMMEKSAKEQKALTNKSTLDDFLSNTYGTEAPKAVEARAAELGYDVQTFVQIGMDNPNAFVAMMGQPTPTNRNTAAPNEVRTASPSFNKPNERDKAYYDKLRRENKSLYFNSKTQWQMQQDAIRLGEKFFNS